MRWNKIGIIGLGFIFTGCASTTPALDVHTSKFGDATAANINAQRVAPTAKQKADTFIPPNRARKKLARDAYETGTVEEPVSVVTTSTQ